MSPEGPRDHARSGDGSADGFELNFMEVDVVELTSCQAGHEFNSD